LTHHGPPKPRRLIAINEAKLKGEWLHLWAAIDMDTKGIWLFIYASWWRSGLNAYMSIRKVLRVCLNKPLILVDGRPWFPRMGSKPVWLENGFM
jgi:transposase-like protein